MATASSPNFTYRQGTMDTVVIPSPASTAINPGDLIWNNAGVAGIASAYTWTSNLATTQTNFRANFLGISLDEKIATDTSTRNILVATRGQFLYPCAALGSPLHQGTFVNADKDTGNNLLDQQFVNVASGSQSIGVISREAASGDTQLEISIQSFLIFGGYGA